MKEELSWSASEEARWLFKPRLQFMDAQQSILSRISDRSLLQDLQNCKKKECPTLNRPIASHKDIQHQLDVLNSIIIHCRFSQTSINATLKQSRNEMKMKKQVKDVEKHCKAKVRKLMDLFGCSEEEEEHWKAVLNHKNIIEHLHKMYIVLGDVINNNFDLIEQASAHLKEQSLPPKLQIQICMLAIDIISLISCVKFAYLPYSCQEIKDNCISKFQQEEKKFLDEGLQSLDSPLGFAKTYRMLKDIKINKFYTRIERIAEGLDHTARHYKVWVDVFSIKRKYLIDDEGLFRTKFDGKLQSTCVNQIALYWMNINIQHLHYYQHPQQTERIHFGPIFKEYQHIFNFLLQQATEKPAKIEGVTSYLGLISAVWLDVDNREASRLLWQELIKISNRIQLPQQYLNSKKDLIVEIGNNIINGYEQNRNQKYLQKLKEFALSNSRQLLNLDYLSDIVNDYLCKQYDILKLLLRERKSFEDQLQSIRTILSKITQPYQIRVPEQGQEGSSELKCSKTDQYQPSLDNNIVNGIRQLSDKLGKDIDLNSNKLNGQTEEEVILQLYQTFSKDKDLIDDIKHFRLLAICFTEVVSVQSLQKCLAFYRAKRQMFIQDKSQLSRERINQMRFGIMDSIRVVIFELMAVIKFERQEQRNEKEVCGVQQRLQNMVKKLLKIYNLKIQMRKRQQNLESNNQNPIQGCQLLMLRRSSSYDMDPHSFYVEDVEITSIENEDDFKEDGFSRNLMKKILELRVEVIVKKLEGLEAHEQPLRQQYHQIKQRIYTLPAAQIADTDTVQDISALPEIEYDFLMKKYYQGWRKLRNLRNPIEQTLKTLERACPAHNNILKLYANLYYKYKQHHKTTQNHYNAGELTETQVQKLINECLEDQNKRNRVRPQEETRNNIRRAIKILQNLQMISTLKKQRDQQQQKLQTLQEAKHYRSEKEELKLKQLEGKLQISSVYKNDTPIMKRYILHVEVKEFDQLLIKLKKLTRLNRTITLKPDKQKSTIIMEVDQQQLTFESYPKLIKYLIESYLEIIEFCNNQLHFQLYPLVLHRHIKIGKRHDNHIPLKFYPYQGILLNILLDYKELKLSTLYKYPQFPFIEFSNQLSILIFKCKDKIYDFQNPTSEFYAFKHLIEEMKALSMEVEEGTRQTVKRILKCPYFWSSTDKLFELVQFKERYQSNINIEESRRKQNQRIRSQLQTEEEHEAFTPERKHPLYKTASGYNKTTQFYFSIEGLLEKQAFLQDIGNFKDKQQEYKYHAYWWIKDKKEIQRLIQMVSERQRRKGCRKATVYEKTFNSFQNQIRNLRNLAVHYIYDDQNKKEIDLQEKINIFQFYFPKLFIFLYRWRPYLGKDYVNEIKIQKVKFLKDLFNKEDKRQVYRRLESIQELSDYNIKNINGYLLKLFGYDFARINCCDPCKIICNSLSKQDSLWSFLEDIKRAKTKEGKDMTFNLLFWEHEKKACNGMRFLDKAYFNVKQRNQFTTEEFSHVKSSLTLLQVEKQRLQKKIQRQQLREVRRSQKSKDNVEDDEDESSSEESTKDADSRNKQSVERRFNKLNGEERDRLYEQMANTDYVCKYFMFQLEMKLPYLFYDLRKERYQWDDRASQFPTNA